MIQITAVKQDSDIEVIAQLAKEIWTHHYTPIIGIDQVNYMLEKFQSESSIKSQLVNGYEYHLLKFDDRPAGYIAFCYKDGHLFLSKIYVHANFRGKGIGKAAMCFMENEAQLNGYSKIRLTVNKHNSNSILAYEKMGFETITAIVQDIGNGYVMDDYVLEKKLN